MGKALLPEQRTDERTGKGVKKRPALHTQVS